jgi:hypothetical protein
MFMVTDGKQVRSELVTARAPFEVDLIEDADGSSGAVGLADDDRRAIVTRRDWSGLGDGMVQGRRDAVPVDD